MTITHNSDRKTVVLITDYRGQFYSALRVSTGGMDVGVISNAFKRRGYSFQILTASDFDPRKRYDDAVILYQSSEDRHLSYKSYMQDIVITIERNGGLLIPNLHLFQCHENKVFQSMLFAQLEMPNLVVPRSRSFGTYEEIVSCGDKFEFPVVIKKSSGCQSKSVAKANSYKELLKLAKRMSSTFNAIDYVRFKAKSLLKSGYIRESVNRSKFVVQQLIPGLKGDYKVLVYWNKVFVLSRKNRPNDFRASGSGLFEFERNIPELLLETAYRFREHFNCPYVSLDLGYKEEACYLIEAQFMMFGTYTLEKAPFHYERDDTQWSIVDEQVNLEDQLVFAVDRHINHLFSSAK